MAGPKSRDWTCLACRLRHLTRHAKVLQQRPFSQNAVRSQAIRPPNAPAQTPNINHLRRNQKAYEDNSLKRRYLDRAEEARTFDKQYEHVAALRKQVQEPKKRLRELEKRIGALYARKTKETQSEVEQLRKEALAIKEGAAETEASLSEAEQRLHSIALGQPSLTSPQTPVNNAIDDAGNTTSEPVLLEYLNYDPESQTAHTLKNGTHPSHTAIGADLSLLDFSSASTTSGFGWYYLRSQAALLEQALIQYALSVLVKRGWTIVSPPSIVYSYIAEACGFQPRDQNDEQQIYELAQPARELDAKKPSRSLAGTAEIPLAAMFAGQSIPSNQLPLKVAGVSRCYRAEAGSRGTLGKGLYRVHEFNKVEMFAWTDSPDPKEVDPLASPEQWTQYSQPVFEEMVEIQKEILTALNLPCRVLEMPISDLGASAYRKIDIEAFFPSRYRRPSPSFPTTTANTPPTSQPEAETEEYVPPPSSSQDNGWGELTSTSICTDYQSRRLGTRIKPTPTTTTTATTNDQSSSSSSSSSATTTTRFAHTVNGTAIAVPRVLAALLEYGYTVDEDGKGRVEIPEVLRRFMPGSTSAV